MSSISSSTAASGISQFLQNLVSSGASSSNASSGSTTSTSGHHHHHGGGFQKLADAVTNALQSVASSNGSGGTTASDANQTITQALTKIFQNGSLGSTDDSDSTDAADSTDSTANNAQQGAAGTTSTAAGLPASFAQTLQSFGVTAQQFQTDVTTALKNAQQSGTADLSTAFKSFPTGSFVDALG